MKAIRIAAAGGPEQMHLEEVARPTPGPGEALVRIEAAGVNFIDVYRRSGQYKMTYPATLGAEGAGTVVEVAPGVGDVSRGGRVASVEFAGSYAEYAVAPVEKLVPVPAGLSAVQAAAALLQGMTAQYLACSTYPLQAGHTCLVHAAAGGVGLLLCQIARMRGAHVIATAGGPEKTRLASEAGANDTIDYTRQDFVEEVRKLTGGKGVQVVYDSVGKDTFEKGLECLSRRGMMVLFGQSSGAVAPINPQDLNAKGSLYLTRPTLFHYVADRRDLLERAGQVYGWVAAGQLNVRVFRELPLSEAAEAHRLLESRKTTGKVVLVP